MIKQVCLDKFIKEFQLTRWLRLEKNIIQSLWEQLQREGVDALSEARGFTIKDVQTGNGIYNLKELRFWWRRSCTV